MTCGTCGREVREIEKPTAIGMWPIGIGLCGCDDLIWETRSAEWSDVYAPVVRYQLLDLCARAGMDIPSFEEDQNGDASDKGVGDELLG